MILVKGRWVNVNSNPIKLFNNARSWVLPIEGIDLEKLEEATQFFVGHHYVRNFVRVNPKEVSILKLAKLY